MENSWDRPAISIGRVRVPICILLSSLCGLWLNSHKRTVYIGNILYMSEYICDRF